MSFVDAMIVLIVMGILSHYLYKKKDRNRTWLASYSIIVVGSVLLFDIMMYAGWLDWVLDIINKLPWLLDNPIESGKEAMWNAFRYFGVDMGVEPTEGMDIVAVFIFFCYLPLFNFWKDGSRQLFGSKSYEEGMLYPIEPLKKPKNLLI